MEYAKPALKLDEQVDLLIERGMDGDARQMRECLQVVSYYRLSGYWYHRKEQGTERFLPGTTFDIVWKQYSFDRRLRLLLMEAIEQVEVSLRTLIAYHHSLVFGPFGYAVEPHALPGLSTKERSVLLLGISAEVDRSKEAFIKHFRDRYGDHHDSPPIWIATETLSFGKSVQLWNALPNDIKKEISSTFELSFRDLHTWFRSLNEVRNVCAHHGRLWNRPLINKPRIPEAKHHPAWHQPETIANQRVYAAFAVSAHLLKVLSPNSTWHQRVRALVESAQGICPLKNMGVPPNWLDSDLWASGR